MIASWIRQVRMKICGQKCWPERHAGPKTEFISIQPIEETGISINGLNKEKGIQTIIAWLEKQGIGKATVNYKMRDWLFSRQRYWGEPFPVIHWEDGEIEVLER